MSKISKSDVQKVAQLARLELPDDQIETYTSQLEEILSYVDQLQEIDTKNIPPTTRAVEVVNAMRDDLVEVNCSREDILNQAPQREGDFFRVPKIL
ncbi:Asp-tRNA(Asn)/Glu-tRNA(Gln) amidotransferase subunit GatC [Prochlorococcus marinus]|uniref:Aspartyl/glutamyl-tRNA(Asn/Gln) amidotransferase subunit C n=1 Tax=Prochlorococcus marinus XMU1408 TaxID=2213228 RepID=A0A318R2I8_PROMR|nr:Asp-tRNA(Asn)/Glu-tRNA(Gln) amidotransferase subunit GatC [Prochlorococcus marinus]MBW3041295.1 Asp-tRNA(Asn)/Glu-tRNA(Gln) amidotransferase GatCAB subunit C [Prochlorococcus marinus str. XMU1408]PYE02470.1 Asp-tRNA(Asn)/Glu-tRNA(Gln) amidotransferase GatCAB subunit C [Prochlorococcus marinus XMU1408]